MDKKGVEVIEILVYSILKPKNAEDFAWAADWHKRVPSYVESGKLPEGVVPLKTFPGGLEDLPEALDYLRQGKISGKKAVVALK